MQPSVEERRRYKRHKLENSIAVSSLGIFQIIDISRGGFRFTCPPHISIPDSFDTDILALTSSLECLPAKRIWSSMSVNDDYNYRYTAVGAEFGKLPKAQETLLSKLINDIMQ